MDPVKIAIIVNLPPPKSIKQLHTTFGHNGYYKKFIKGYAQIIAPMEKKLKKILSLNGHLNVKKAWIF